MTSIAPFLPADTQAAAADVTRAQLETKLKKGNKFTPEELAAAERRGWIEPLFKLGQSIGIASDAFRQLNKIVTGAGYDVAMEAMEADPRLVSIAAPFRKGALKKIGKSGKQLIEGLFGRGAEGSQPSLKQLSGKSEKRIVSPEEAVEDLTGIAAPGKPKKLKLGAGNKVLPIARESYPMFKKVGKGPDAIGIELPGVTIDLDDFLENATNAHLSKVWNEITKVDKAGLDKKQLAMYERSVKKVSELMQRRGLSSASKDIAPTGNPLAVALELILDNKSVNIRKFSIDDLKVVQKKSMEELSVLSPEDAGSGDVSRAYNLAVQELRKRGEPVAESLADLAASGLLSGNTIKELGLGKALQSKKFNKKDAIDILSKHGHVDDARKILDPGLLEEFEVLFKGDFINVRDLFELLGY